MNDYSAVPAVTKRLPFADAIQGTRRVFIKDLALQARIGVYDHERLSPQPVLINIDMRVPDDKPASSDDLDDVVCYHQVVQRVQALCADADHINLLETLAEEIAEACFADRRVIATRIKVEKPAAIDVCVAVGIEIERLRPL
ncbi:MAG: dihydroneopterin aldolase [Pseudomonadota bacterium]